MARGGQVAARDLSQLGEKRWLFSQPSGQDLKLLWNPAIGLGACGDWLYHGFAEYAWLSGHVLGAAIAAEAPR